MDTMAVDGNTVLKDKLIPQSVDFVEQFNKGLTTLINVLGITRKQALALGSTVKIYKSTVTLADEKVAEGEVIPLSEVKKELSDTKELTFNKWRKNVTAEAIQSSGFQGAVAETDSELLKAIQKRIKKDLFDEFANGTGKAEGNGFQQSLAKGLGQLAVAFEDEDITSVALVNPIDFYDYVGSAPVTVQTVFGMTYIQNFLGVNTIIMSNNVPAGTVYVTASQNLNLFFATLNGGSLSQAFNFTTDQTGLVGIAHEPKNDSLSYESVVADALLLLPERLDGIIVSTIATEAGTDSPS